MTLSSPNHYIEDIGLMLRKIKFKLFYKLSFLFLFLAVVSIFTTTYSIVITAYEFRLTPDFVHTIKITALTNFFVMFLIFTAASFVLARQVTKPLEDLRRHVRSIASGDFWGELNIRTQDEMELLSEDVNNLAKDLRLHQANLKDEIQKATEALLLQKTRLESILNSITDGLVMTYLNGQTFLLNPKARELLGIENNAPSVEKQMIWEIIADEESAGAFKKAFNGAAGGAASFEIITQKPAKLTLKVFPSDVKDEKGNLYGKVFVLHDITREKEIDRMKSDFVSTVSHELRTPLTSISGFVSTLLREDLMLNEGTKIDFLKSIKTATERLTRLIGDLLDVSRIEAGKVDLNKMPFSLYSLAMRVIKNFSEINKSHTFALDVPEHLPRVLADEDKIQQVLENLLSNAVRYSPRGGKILLSAEDAGDKIRVSVSDEGVGIPADQRELVFQRFHRVDSSHTRNAGGTGLGLYICRRILDAHGERIWIEKTAPEKGTTFSFILAKMQ